MSAQDKVRGLYAADRRLVLLLLLTECGDRANSSMLTKALVEVWHHGYADRYLIHSDLRWLEVRGLVNVEELTEGVLGATITDDGEAVAKGRKRVEGIARPSGS